MCECVGKYSESTGCYQVLSHLAAVHHPINSEKGYHTQEGTGAWRESKVVTTTLQSPAYPVLFNSEETNLVELEALLSHRVWHVLLRQTVMVTKTLTNALVKRILEICREYFCNLGSLLQHSVTTHTQMWETLNYKGREWLIVPFITRLWICLNFLINDVFNFILMT